MAARAVASLPFFPIISAARASMSLVTSGSAGPASAGGKFQPMILRGIMAGGEVDRAVEFAAHDFAGDRGVGVKVSAEQRANVMLLQDIDGELRKLFGIETCDRTRPGSWNSSYGR